jgi:NAD(P)-dependent dehydrogenase (short-subunit alcohol dehydrogenase family)
MRGNFFGVRKAALPMQPNASMIVNIVSIAAYNASNGANSAHK